MEEKNFVRINPLEYAKKGIESGELKPVVAIKATPVAVRRGEVGEVVRTYSQDGIVESEHVVKIDETTGLPQMILTKLDKNGDVVIDEYGHENSWIYKKCESQFALDYPTQLREGVYVPAATPRILLPIVMDVLIPQWGSLEAVAAGGWLNITNLDDIYGVSGRDIDETHIILGEAKDFKLTK